MNLWKGIKMGYLEDKVFICNNKNERKEVTKDIRYFNDYHNSYNITFKNNINYCIKYENTIILYNAKKIEIDPFLFGRFFCVDEAYLYKDETRRFKCRECNKTYYLTHCFLHQR